MKKFFTSFLLLVLFFSHSLSIAEASSSKIVGENTNKWTEEKVTEKLLKLGFTDEQINLLNWETKLEIVKDKKVKKLLSFQHKRHSFYDPNSSEDEFTLLGLENDLYINIAALDYGNKNGNPYVKLVADYNWKNIPVFRLQDAFAISWSEGWYAESWGFTEQQRFCSYYEHGCVSYYWQSNKITKARDQDRLAGVGWIYDLKAASSGAKGNAYVYLLGNNKSLIKSTTYSAFKVWYGHDKWNSNISVNISAPIGAGIAAGVSFGDEEYIQDSTSILNSSLKW